MKIINIPRTQTILAVGILAGCFVTKIEWRDALLMVLTFYFTKHDPGKITIHQPHSKPGTPPIVSEPNHSDSL